MVEQNGDEYEQPPAQRPSPVNWCWKIGISYYPTTHLEHDRICVAIHDPVFVRSIEEKAQQILSDEMRIYVKDPQNYSGWLAGERIRS